MVWETTGNEWTVWMIQSELQNISDFLQTCLTDSIKRVIHMQTADKKHTWLHCWNIIWENDSQVVIRRCHWHIRIYPKYFTTDDATSPSTSCHMTNFIRRFLAKNENKRLHRFKLAPIMTNMSQRAERELEQKVMQEKQTLPFPVKVTVHRLFEDTRGLGICILVLTSFCTAISTD